MLIGAATRSNGVLRLLKALRHEVAGVEETAARLGVKAGNDALALVLKTFHTAHGGKMSIARMLAGQAGDGTTFNTPEGEAGRVSAVFKVMGQHFEKRGQATAGETVAFGKLDNAKTGDTLSSGKQAHAALVEVKPYPPVLAVAVQAKERKDDVKLGAAFTKLTEEDPSLSRRAQCREPRSGDLGPGRNASARGGRAARRTLCGAGRDAPAGGRLSRNHPQAGHHSRPPQEAVRRPRPVRRRGAGDQAAAALAPASSSRTRSPAAWCRAITSRRWRRA